uniref:(northern house mosquito) hypothetical protein n=1 Tax=Culex pipiens TaxID=7175 RepID=A0A8D8NWA1_CULPI
MNFASVVRVCVVTLNLLWFFGMRCVSPAASTLEFSRVRFRSGSSFDTALACLRVRVGPQTRLAVFRRRPWRLELGEVNQTLLGRSLDGLPIGSFVRALRRSVPSCPASCPLRKLPLASADVFGSASC